MMVVGGPLVHTGAHHSPRGPTPTALLADTAKQYWVSGRRPRTTAAGASPASPTTTSPRSKRSTPGVSTVRACTQRHDVCVCMHAHAPLTQAATAPNSTYCASETSLQPFTLRGGNTSPLGHSSRDIIPFGSEAWHTMPEGTAFSSTVHTARWKASRPWGAVRTSRTRHKPSGAQSSRTLGRRVAATVVQEGLCAVGHDVARQHCVRHAAGPGPAR
jgi:hypothetical protein